MVRRDAAAAWEGSLKDWVLFRGAQLEAAGAAARDNTGGGGLDAGRATSSAAFPSDHAVVSVALRSGTLPR